MTTKRNFASILGEAAGVEKGKEEAVDIITFTEAPWGLGMGTVDGVPPLLPAQKFILKAYYGMELDDTVKYIPVNDKFNENLLYMLTEKGFHEYLLEEGRISPGALDGTRTTLALICGRRATKTTVTSIIANYEMYRMLLEYHPQKYFGIMPDDVISLTCLSTSEDSAKIVYDRVAGNMERALFFKDYMSKSPNKTEMYLQSSRDQKEFTSGKYTFEFIAEPCSARGLRGRNNILIVMDEVAHFFKEGNGKANSNNSDKAIYEAVKPSLAAFKYPNGNAAGRIIAISSPSDKSGLLWDLYEWSQDEEAGKHILMVQLPSWEMNPTIAPEFLKGEYAENPLVYMTEYGSQFSDRLSGWIEDESLVLNAIQEGRNKKERSSERVPHFMGIDVGLKKDGTAICVCHIEDRAVDGELLPIIVVDWWGVRYAKDEKSYDPETGRAPVFEPEEMAEWIAEVHGKYYIQKGILDQYYSLSVLPAIKRKNITNIEDRFFNDTKNSEVYQNLMAKFVTKSISLPDAGGKLPDGRPKNSDLVDELLGLQMIQKSKYVIKVFTPEGKDKHDDLSDALARAVKAASEYLESGGRSAGSAPRLAGNRSTLNMLNKRMLRQELKRPSTGMIYKSQGMRYGGGLGMGPGPRRFL